MDTKKRRIAVFFDCEHIAESPILGKITAELLEGGIQEFFKLYFADVEIYPEEGDFYKLLNPIVHVNPQTCTHLRIDQEDI